MHNSSILPIITIDGPSGSGKGTLSRKLAKILKWNLLDSGMIYRILVTLALANNVNLNNEKELLKIFDCNKKISFVQKDDNFDILYNDKLINKDIYTEIIGNFASQIAVFTKVRTALLEYQRSFYMLPGLVADGRDMGTIVFPDAIVKIFLYTSAKEREQRRLEQLQKMDFNVNLRSVLLQIRERDNRDYNRKIAPLVPASDALILDATYLSEIEVENEVMSYIKEKIV